jgi:hypothetical protein
MSKLPLSLSLIAVAILAACETTHRVAPAPAPITVQPSPPAAAVVVPPSSPAPSASAPTVIVPQTTTPAPIVVAPAPAQPLRAGTGRIESILDIPPSAAAGSGIPGANKRIGIRMDDGSLQYVDTAATGIAIGDRVALTSDGYMRHPAP